MTVASNIKAIYSPSKTLGGADNGQLVVKINGKPKRFYAAYAQLPNGEKWEVGKEYLGDLVSKSPNHPAGVQNKSNIPVVYFLAQQQKDVMQNNQKEHIMENNIDKIINRALKEAAATEVVKETPLEESKIQRLKAGDTITINKNFPHFSTIKNPTGKVKKIGNFSAQVTLDNKTYEVHDGEFKHSGVVLEAEGPTDEQIEEVLEILKGLGKGVWYSFAKEFRNEFGYSEDQANRAADKEVRELIQTHWFKYKKMLSNPLTEADANDTSSKADETFKTLEAVLLDLRNAESKLVMGISYDMQNLFGGDLNAIKQVIENASASVENLAKKMHQTLMNESDSSKERFNDDRKLNW